MILGVPWFIVLSSFALNGAIWAVAGLGSEPGPGFTGGILSLYIAVLVVFAQSVSQLLPLAIGVSLSRRVFFLGTALLGGVQALGYGVALAVLSAIENATGGWGVGLSFWTPGTLKVDNLLLQVVVSGAPMLAFIFTGVGIGVVYARWGSSGIWGLTVLGMLVLGGVSVLVTWLRAWGVAVRSSGRHPGDRPTRGPRCGCGRTRFRGGASRRPLTPAIPTAGHPTEASTRVPFRGGREVH